MYNNDDQSMKVRVANPNTPITSTTGALFIEPNTENLIIIVKGRTVMNITDVNVCPYTNVSAKLQNTGNFELQVEESSLNGPSVFNV